MADLESSSRSSSIDPSNCLYLHPSDNPGMILVSKSFDGTGFGAWKRAMTIALSAKNKLSFVDGRSVQPMNPLQIETWKRCNDMVISWILNTLSRDISESVIYTETASQLWKELNDRYGQPNGAKLYQLQKNLCEISQGTDDIATYFTKMKRNWDELNTLSIIPSCTCGASQILAKREEDQRLVQFLMGLNSVYDTIRGNILMMKPFPSINQAYALLIQDEKQREIHAGAQFLSESASMNVNTHSQRQYVKSDSKKSLVCTHCKKSGHVASKCYRLVGFPKDFKFTKSKQFAATVQSDATDAKKSNTSSMTSMNNALTAEQYNVLLQLLQKASIDGDPTSATPNTKPLNYANFAGPFTEEANGSW
ncbi:hypothetical protein E3N88_12990 [Mikania micrantha]|uniref:Retrotransposon Copia-like N-terminal domain-containing protein n=1 Tax=Mikania micrantha TaxID=192012 RepID=A0A5N6P752_9ASTR|nr:hypothetical protein E3N88_12990 [Mikania micrantha]